MERGSGILLHIASLPSPYGIGTMGKEAYQFVDFLEKAGQTYWQILPIGPTSFGDSPYQSFSTFAGNPYFIDLDLLADEGALRQEDYAEIDWGDSREAIDYEQLFDNRFLVLKKAYLHDACNLQKEIAQFRMENSYWIEQYAMYMALKYEKDQKPFQKWEPPLKQKEYDALTSAFERLREEIDFWVYVQYRFFEQWKNLKSYANKKGIRMIGDIPIYVAQDSSDAWSHGEVLALDAERNPIQVAGCPPDPFAPKGQLWGNPLYNWDYLKKTGYEWWMERIGAALSLYDVVRIDHFRGFEAYYAIPFGREDAVEGIWMKGPGRQFFEVLKQKFGPDCPIIAEDLGTLTREVREMLQFTGYPGMKVMQFGFEPGQNSEYLPHNYQKNCVAYIGTHDNDTFMGWLDAQPDYVQEFASAYLRLKKDETVPWGAVQTLLASVADVSIVMLQDLLGLGSEARINEPSTLGNNWMWRLKGMEVLNSELTERLAAITKIYSR